MIATLTVNANQSKLKSQERNLCKLNKGLLMIMILNLMISNLSAKAPKMSDSNDTNSENNLEQFSEDHQVEINESEGSNFDDDETKDAKTDDAKTNDKNKLSGSGNEGFTASNTENDKKGGVYFFKKS